MNRGIWWRFRTSHPQHKEMQTLSQRKEHLRYRANQVLRESISSFLEWACKAFMWRSQNDLALCSKFHSGAGCDREHILGVSCTKSSRQKHDIRTIQASDSCDSRHWNRR